MGKAKNRKRKPSRPRPTGVPSVKELEAQTELGDVEVEVNNVVQHVIEKLQSRSVEDKECAAGTIAKMAGNPEFVSSVLDNGVIRIVSPLLLDPSLSVRHTVAGCLRNLCACGGPDVSKAMVDQDVMTALVALFKQYNGPWSPMKSVDDKIDSKKEIFFEACSLLWSLCESSDVAVAVFNDNDLVSVLLPCLNVEVFGLDIPIAVAHCLHTISEENPEAIKYLSQSLALELLESVMSLKPLEPAHVLLRTLAAGIYLNVHSGKIENCTPSATHSILGLIVENLDIPMSPYFPKLAEEISKLKDEKRNRHREAKNVEQKLASINDIRNKLDHMIPAKQITLEILTNICFSDDGSDWDDVGSSDMSDEMDVDDLSSPVTMSLQIPCEVHSLIVNQNLLAKVIGQIYLPADEKLSILYENHHGKKYLKKLRTVVCRALLCASNIIQGLDINELGGAEEAYKLWLHFGSLMSSYVDIDDTELLEASTSSIRAILQKLTEANYKAHFMNLKEEEILLLINIGQQSPDSNVKVNIIRSVATLGCILGNISHNCSSKLINVIGSFLLDIGNKNSELWVIAEALDALFDVFANDHLNNIAKEISLLEKLNHLLPHLKGKIKQQRRSLGPHLPIIMTAKTNLLRFIKYKTAKMQ